MSLKVELADLSAKASEYGPGFLLSADGSGGPHAMHVRFVFSDGNGADVVATCSVGRSAARNVETNPLVTLLWPPLDDGGYSLIADGEARVNDGQATIKMLGAVLHRHA